VKIQPIAPSTFITSLFAALLMPCLAGSAGAQTDEPEAASVPSGIFTEEVSVRVINVDVIVTDRSGKAVAGLGREDFELRVDGEPVPISNFYSEEGEREAVTGRPALPAPRRDPSFRSLEEIRAGSPRRSHVVILIDHTRLSASNRKRAFAALRQAVDRFGEDDLVAVVGVEKSLVFYSDFLFDREAVHRILDDVSRVSLKTDLGGIERRQIFGELARGMSGGIQARASLADSGMLMARIRSYAAEEYDRGIQSLAQIEKVVATLAGVPGRKSLLYVGEGVATRPGEGLYIEFRNRFAGPERGLPHQDFNTDYTQEVGHFDLNRQMDQLADTANRAGVALYAIDAESSHSAEIRSALTEQGAFSEALTTIDENFREPLEFVSKATGGRFLQSSGTLADQLVELAGGLRTFYSLGFAPPAGWQSGSDHKLDVKVKGKGLVVNHREQVRMPEPDEREAGATVAALMYQTVDNPLEISAKPGFEVPREDGQTAALPVNLEIPIKNLGFLPQEGAQACSLTIYVSVKDKDGNPGKIQKIPFHLAIPDDKMEQALTEAAHYPLPLILRRGDRQVAIGIRDNLGGQFSAIRLDVAQYSQF
jgi:VWFA-related protein